MRMPLILFILLICSNKIFSQSRNIYSSIEDAIKLKDSITELNLSNQKITSIPLQLKEFSNLEKLNLSKNNIKSINLKDQLPSSLKYLDLSSNSIEEFNLSSLPNLIFLNLSENQLAKNDINFVFPNLKQLWLSKNKFIEIPNSIFKLNKLVELDLYSNRITNIPNKLINLKSLNQINLSNNEILKIDKKIIFPKSLKNIEISGNQIREISNNIFTDGITQIDLTANKIETFHNIKFNNRIKAYIILEGNEISEKEYKILVKKLPNSNIIWNDNNIYLKNIEN